MRPPTPWRRRRHVETAVSETAAVVGGHPTDGPDDGPELERGPRRDPQQDATHGPAGGPGSESDEGRTDEGADEPGSGSPLALTRATWGYVMRRTVRSLGEHQATDAAAALTYYAVLAVAPGLIALVSLLSIIGQSERAVNGMLRIAEDLGPADAVQTVEPIIARAAANQGAGLGLLLGLAGALWSASGFVGAFGRAMNRIYGIEEGRPVWKLRPVLLAVTFVALAFLALVFVGLVVSGPVARAVGDAMGVGDTAVLVWDIVKWPVVLALVTVVVALLYYATPNVKQPRFRWISPGAGLAIGVWVLASAAFGFYVSRFSNYDATYGSLAGIIVALLWLWITSLALLFGAELDAEIERGRELQAGVAAEVSLSLMPRDTTASTKRAAKRAEDVAVGRALRATRGRSADRGERQPDPGG